MVRNRLKVLVSSCATTAVVAIVVGMVGPYFTPVPAICGGLMWPCLAQTAK